MAKKMSGAKKTTAKPKSTSSRKGKSKSGTNYVLLIFMVALVAFVGIGTLYFIREKTSNSWLSKKNEANKTTEAPTKAKKIAESEKPKKSISSPSVKQPKLDDEPAIETPKRNEKIEVSPDVDELYFTSAFDFAWPAYNNTDQIIERDAFTLNYDENAKQAKWVAYKLSASNLSAPKLAKPSDFKADPLVRSNAATPQDFKNGTYDMGQLAPFGDFAWSVVAAEQTCYMSNISPQAPIFKKGIWKKLELKVNDWAKQNGELYVVTGPIFGTKIERIGKNKVGVPDAFFKIVLDIKQPDFKAIGFIIPNAGTSDDIMYFAANINDIELLTGLDFFPSMPDELEAKIESSLNKSFWK